MPKDMSTPRLAARYNLPSNLTRTCPSTRCCYLPSLLSSFHLSLRSLGSLLLALTGSGCLIAADTKPQAEPKVVDPGPPPSDAIVLFDGKDLSQWKNDKGGAAQWKLEDGAMVVNGTGSIATREAFGDVQLHVEWATPSEVKGHGQERGNSGIFLLGPNEIQVLDSYNNPTYFDGQAAAYYGHNPPLVNASRKPGEWQTYDIIFHTPKLQPDGKVAPGSFTILHNDVLVQDHVPVAAAKSRTLPSKAPIVLQDHGNPVRYRNIWVWRL